ncbi:MAG: IS1595 family transposase [Verrucomicrobiae bacterium]|nr:IS1595 family transposase [Verrucomicrobiae bacterium]
MKLTAPAAKSPVQSVILDADDLNLITLAQEYQDEDKARSLLEILRWPHGAVCPRCQNDGKTKPNSKLTPKAGSKTPVRKGVYFCGACRQQFTVTVGTAMEGSHVPISKWLMAFFLISSSKKGMSANQLHRMLKLTYKTAWFMAHRIRYAMGDNGGVESMLKGVVEVDETFVGGKGVMCSKSRRKTPVMALVERGGKMKARVISNVTQMNLGKVLNECVSKTATVNTDELPAYRNPLKDWKAHNAVNHSKKQYSRKMEDGSKAGINGCESFFSLLKRGVYGAWHCVSREHLQKYTNEFSFRWNTRFLTDGARMAEAVPMITGKRLFYRQPEN